MGFFEPEGTTPAQGMFPDQQSFGTRFPGIVGESAALKRVLDLVRIVAPTRATVLINGETGTGKELVAEAIHKCSDRANGPFVKVNCAAIPAGLLESELFGHERGAYTGAIARGIGRFERANGGTLFLDEIGDLPLELQPKLLRVIQERRFERLGGSTTIHADVRVVCATHRNLIAMVNEREFRADLFYRLSVFPIEVPPLRNRREDIPSLVRHFAMDYAARMRKRIRTIAEDFMAALARHSWPGNIRELQNCVERAVILATGPVLTGPVQGLSNTTFDRSNGPRIVARGGREDAENSQIFESFNGAGGLMDGQAGAVAGFALRTLAEAERKHISEVVEMTNGLIAGKGGAAEVLGVPPSTLRNRMKKLGIQTRWRS
jgi:formate hydrogenlyase transcriptional activator